MQFMGDPPNRLFLSPAIHLLSRPVPEHNSVIHILNHNRIVGKVQEVEIGSERLIEGLAVGNVGSRADYPEGPPGRIAQDSAAALYPTGFAVYANPSELLSEI